MLSQVLKTRPGAPGDQINLAVDQEYSGVINDENEDHTYVETTEMMLDLEISLHWWPVLTPDGNRFPWHREPARAARDREQLEGPRVYRWILRSKDNIAEPRYYIGETSAFHRRLAKYRSGKLNRKGIENYVPQKMRECEALDGEVQLEFLNLDAEPLRINGRLLANSSLFDRSVRLMMESIAVYVSKTQNLFLLNSLGENADYKTISNLLVKILGVNNPKTQPILALIKSMQKDHWTLPHS
ncbi:MAG TPA: hypothetical protein VHX20_09540 [Terracidiphilus sp.]|nr:hypothetical protein [Terracidiphilus sp.]